MRFWYQSMTEDGQYGRYRDAVERHAGAVLDGDVDVAFHGVRPGTYGGRPPIALLTYPYAYHVLLSQVLDHVLEAERSGCEAFVIGSYSEPFLTEARSVVDIPVVSMAESTLLVGCSVAPRSALVTVTPQTARMAEKLVARHELGARVSGIHVIDPPVDEDDLIAAFDHPAPFLERLAPTVRSAVAGGADVLIPAEGVLNELLFAAGVRRLEDVSVMDSVGVTLLYARMMVQLARRTGLGVGRRWGYPRPDAAAMALLRRDR